MKKHLQYIFALVFLLGAYPAHALDASAVTYTAPLTGAVERTLAEKLAETVSVTDFGAVPDGDPAQTQAAFEAAIAAVQDYSTVKNHVLHIPAGNWRLNAKLTIPSNVKIVGAGKYATRLFFPSLATPLISLKGSVNTDVSGLYIDNGSAVAGSVAVDMTDAYDTDVSRIIGVNVDIGVWLYGTYAKGAYYNTVSSVTISGTNRVGLLIDSAVDYSNSNRNVISDFQAHHSTLPFAILRGNNNSLYDPNGETGTAIAKYFLIDKAWGTVIVNPRAEKGGSGAAGIGIHVTSNARGTAIIEGNFQNLTAEILNQGQGTSRVSGGYTPPVLGDETPAEPGAARYWGVVKTNAAMGGGYHTELQVEGASGAIPVTYSMMYAQSDLTGVSWAALIDGNLSSNGFHTDSADPGAHFRLDFGSAVELKKWRFYVSGNVPCTWNVVKSTDGVNWQTVATGLDVSGGAGWKELAW